MNVKQIEKFLTSALVIPQTNTPGYSEWLKCDDVLEFFRKSIYDDVPVYLSCRGFYLYSVFVPQNRLKKDFVEDLLKWNFGPSDGWGYGVFYNKTKKPSAEICPPLNYTGSEILESAEPIFFLREFLGYQTPSYLEINQRFSHISGVHWVEHKKAYCRINDEGDFDEIVVAKRNERDIVCTVKRDALNFYMFLTKSVMIRVFDITRCVDVMDLLQTDRTENKISNEEFEIYSRRILIDNNNHQPAASSLRGVQILQNQNTFEDLIGEKKKHQDYATFIAHDWKHQKICECSSDPTKLGNYFVKSDLPYGTSPAFFKPEVLSKYKQDPDKYTVEQRSISCRGSWYLKTYDINEAGQVHTYLVYLGQLPYKEQLYWKSFNEPPKASISKRAITTDFKGDWSTEYDPLESLKSLLREYPTANHDGNKVSIWSLPPGQNERVLTKIHYVITESKKEWQDQILELAKLIVDGLKKRVIRKIAKSLGCDNPLLGSLKLLATSMHARNIDNDVIDEIMAPLYKLWEMRSAISAHGGKAIPDKDLKADYRKTVAAIHNSMDLLAGLISKGMFNLPLSNSGVDNEFT